MAEATNCEQRILRVTVRIRDADGTPRLVTLSGAIWWCYGDRIEGITEVSALKTTSEQKGGL